MVMISDLPQKTPVFVNGTYRLQETVRVTNNGNDRFDAVLADRSGTIECEEWSSDLAGRAYLNQLFDCVLLIERKESGRVLAKFTSAEQICRLEYGDLVKLSDRLFPIPKAVQQLLAMIRSCQIPLIQKFLLDVVSSPAIAVPFFILPASREYHHDYPGGLLEHSLETQNIALSSLPNGSQEEITLTMVAALLHDIGKIRTLTESGSRTTEGRVMRHELLSLEILSESLSKLAQKWPNGAIALRYLLTYKPEQIKRPLLPCAMTINYADRMSASYSARQKAISQASPERVFVTTRSKGPVSTFWKI